MRVGVVELGRGVGVGWAVGVGGLVSSQRGQNDASIWVESE